MKIFCQICSEGEYFLLWWCSNYQRQGDKNCYNQQFWWGGRLIRLYSKYIQQTRGSRVKQIRTFWSRHCIVNGKRNIVHFEIQIFHLITKLFLFKILSSPSLSLVEIFFLWSLNWNSLLGLNISSSSREQRYREINNKRFL